MDVRLTHQTINRYPIAGLLVKGEKVTSWLSAIDELNLELADIEVYGLPGNTANTVWGCAILLKNPLHRIDPGRHELLQVVIPSLYIVEKSDVFPTLTKHELDKLFSSGIHIMHPSFGLVEVDEKIDFQRLLEIPEPTLVDVTRPRRTVQIPGELRSFEIVSQDPEDVLKNLSENVFPAKENMKDDSLSTLEKMKLWFYQALFRRTKNKTGDTTHSTGLGSFMKRLFGSNSKWEELQLSFEELERRNQKQIDKFLDLLKKDPERALMYAIPLDEAGTSRGGNRDGLFNFSWSWPDFSLFGNAHGGGSGPGITLPQDRFVDLQQNYVATAEKLVKEGRHEKAAFIYMKLLKQYHRAAEVMQSGKYYQEAATIHLKHTGNKFKAAECFEQGNMTSNAIKLYEELNEHEKVGDLYLVMGDLKSANASYEIVVERFKAKDQFVKASLVYKNKMNDPGAGQSMLLEGWTKQKDSVNCLSNYFSNIAADDLNQSINHIYQTEVNEKNRKNFLTVIQHEYKRSADLEEPLREMAFEVVAELLKTQPEIVVELKHFNPDNKQLVKDTLRFKLASGRNPNPRKSN